MKESSQQLDAKQESRQEILARQAKEQLDEHAQAQIAHTVTAEVLITFLQTGQLFERIPPLSSEDQQGVKDWMNIIIAHHRREAIKSAEISRTTQERIRRSTVT